MESPKVLAARAALSDVHSGMKLGLGTGTTAAEFVRLLGAAVRSGELRDILCTCTSRATEEQAKLEGLSVAELAAVAPLDLAVDGADEVDHALRLIKGRGAALLREKIVEQQAARFIVIVDESKIVDRLGRGPFPVEITPFALDVLFRRFESLGWQPALRTRDGSPLVTDEGNRIVDLCVPASLDVEEFVAVLRGMAGVVDTGFFPVEATEVIVAGADGIRRLKRD